MLIYLASPYSHDNPEIRHERYKRVLQMTIKLTAAGYFIFSPIVNGHTIIVASEGSKINFSWQFWEKFDKKMISRCDELWVYEIDGWKESVGVQAEIEFARSIGTKVQYINDMFLMG